MNVLQRIALWTVDTESIRESEESVETKLQIHIAALGLFSTVFGGGVLLEHSQLAFMGIFGVAVFLPPTYGVYLLFRGSDQR